MQVRNLLEKIDFQLLKGNLEEEVTDIIYDSRKVTKGVAFVCISGTTVDAHRFIPDAIAKGATVIIVEKEVEIHEAVTVIRVTSARRALAFMSAALFDYPAEKMVTIGLTGTKGKTTTTYMIQKMLEEAGKKVGVIGTIGAVINGEKVKTENTTPESYELHSLFHKMVDAGCEYVVMEVSSQGLKMDRVAGINFDYGVFTNFSADHIGPNEHANMEEYLACKSLLFRQCKVGVINCDDASAEGVLNNHTCEVKTFGFNEGADLRASNIDFLMMHGHLGISFDVCGMLDAHVETNIPGRFSSYNSMVALMIGTLIGLSKEIMLDALANITVRGRAEIVKVSDDFIVMIDYAHNAVSVESLLTTVSEYDPKRIICVYGCGGNRSKLRRYDMGELCGRMADLSILTCDNPRDEEVAAINEDIKVGLARSNGKFIEIEDRTEAIHYALDHAQKGDIIILIGKGHEEYQEINGVKHYYNEREVIEDYANCRTFA
ncbi:UDP-N-acetylmuramoyl-L-alanyl-D-glutamate--2,6-diaminopimelate ligase [Anaerosporobacter faecicola]|uniref:UDP-N-acetylmuramoyl-L-alanyl-D-glutamate--2, 6-diaminopimelate ligase n=1 Tax=Anaerosporobacter faecicola TaxID=2718714 RepID=UPI00143A4EC7|nr:UDP-N-acetylmuramoyl-L-alanyl-D-glutamate--2,6-diaminopimelate ligase [Anaerosporobacter faecicola]